MTAFAIVGATVFDGRRMLEGRAVVVERGLIRSVPKVETLPGDMPRREVEGLIAPGFIDIQVNGGGGVLFNGDRSVEAIRAIGAAHRRFGTTSFLPTLITDTRDVMAEAVEAARAGLAASVPGLLGVHLEGPFLNPERKGVHDPRLMRPIEAEDIHIMTSLGAGRTLLTVAPERIPPEALEALSAEALVLAGHTTAGYHLLMESWVRGLKGFTHLYNAMPPMMSREPGPVGAALHDPWLWASIIADLHHVSEPVLQITFNARGTDHVMLVTDAMSTVGSDIESFTFQGRTILRRDGRLTTEDGTLAGSDLDMATAVRNVRRLGIDLEKALAMASLNPARFLELDDQLGRIARGYRASMVLLDDDLHVRATWIDGAEETV